VSLLEALTELVLSLGIPVETGQFTDRAPDTYCVLTELSETAALEADDGAVYDRRECRISLYTKGSYTALRRQIVLALMDADFTVTDRTYGGRDAETGYHTYTVDTAKIFPPQQI